MPNRLPSSRCIENIRAPKSRLHSCIVSPQCFPYSTKTSTTHGRSNCLRWWDGSTGSGLTMFVRTAKPGTFPAMPDWMWWGRNAHPACVGRWRLLAATPASSRDASNSLFWLVWRLPTKAVERHGEAIGADIARGEQAKIDRAVQLELPQVLGTSAPVIYMEMDGT
jgi:hypothetical protein